MALAETHYVDANSATPTSPYTSWATAAVNIQDAVDVAQAGETVLVANGVYAAGGGMVSGLLTTRVLVTQPILIASVNGPAVTVIIGRQLPGTTNGYGAVRCVSLVDGAILAGFTLTYGATLATGGFSVEQSGGGVWCASTNALVTNCVLRGNSAYGAGGGASGGTLNGCVLSGNTTTGPNAVGGGAAFSVLHNCTLSGNSAIAFSITTGDTGLGGGAFQAMLDHCTLSNNLGSFGGGAAYGTLTNCILTGNSAVGYSGAGLGGGAYISTLDNCTLTNNSATAGGGASGSTLNECALSRNSAVTGGGAIGGILNLCTLSTNVAHMGGGTSSSILANCILIGNSAALGGGAAAATLNDCILSSNTATGQNGFGGGAYYGTLTNCTLSGNGTTGPQGSGGGAAYGTLSRCVLSGNSANGAGGGACYGSLFNCAVTSNSTKGPYGDGAGACYGTLNNCTLSSNSASNIGGGAAYAGLNNCEVSGNSAASGGGAAFGTLNNCTVSGNSAFFSGGGAAWATANNCIVYYNTCQQAGDNYDYFSTFNHSCTFPPDSGQGNISAEPELADTSHLSAGSPCRGAGNPTYSSGRDIDGEPWASPPSMGCDEYHAGALTGPLNVGIVAAYTNIAVGFAVLFVAQIQGHAAASRWEFGDGTVVSNRPYASHAWAAPGDYTMLLRVFNNDSPSGASASLAVHVVAQPVHYVLAGSQNPVAPYSSWATAAAAIQDAIDTASVPGALVLVTNGLYKTGGRAINGLLTNRVAVNKPLLVASVNGPAATVITGIQVPGNIVGDGAVRCAYLGDGAILSGFTLTNGATRTSGDYALDQSGGGVWCTSHAAVVTNCVFSGNAVSSVGGGAFSGTLNNCTLVANSALSDSGGGVMYAVLNNCTLNGNTANVGGAAGQSILNNCGLTENSAFEFGGGAAYTMLNNCTLTGNSALGPNAFGGGASVSFLNNCIVYYNRAGLWGDNYDTVSTLNYCCTFPLPSSGQGNIIAEPELADTSHVNAASPCRAAGSAPYAIGKDIDGDPWANPPSIGCDEYLAGSAAGPLSVKSFAAYTNVAVGFAVSFTGQIQGHASASRWEFGDGIVVSNRPFASHAWAAAGDYVVVLQAFNADHPDGVSASVSVHVLPQPVHYVSATSVNPVTPYNSWGTAAATIQDAVDAASVPGALVLVSNGLYVAGGHAVDGLLTNRVAVTKPVVVSGLNGPEMTVIAGKQVPGNKNGDGAVRCVYLADGAVLAGFTMTNGGTRMAGDYALEQSGGGVRCASHDAVVTNCVLTGNSGSIWGAGAFGGSLVDCRLSHNSTDSGSGGGASYAILNRCSLDGNWALSGGGAYFSTLNSCAVTQNLAGSGGGVSYGLLNSSTLNGNTAYGSGGGTYSASVNNCLIGSNNAGGSGGGAYGGTLNNCTLSGNSAVQGGSGSAAATLNNCIVYYNTNGQFTDNDNGSIFNYSCTIPLPTNGIGNFTNAPLFVDQSGGNFRLQSSSPCINAGNNAYAYPGPDLDGNPRIVGGTVDMGAYEFQSPGSIISYAWLQQYGLATDGSADYADPDHDGMNNWQEWVAGTNPTNALSALRVVSVSWTGIGVTLSWQSVAGVHYFVERGTDLTKPGPAFVPLATNIPGQDGITTYYDTTIEGAGGFFYRVGVGY
jgi:hypothetical protein